MGNHSLLQGIFLTWRSDSLLLHWQAGSFTTEPPGKPFDPGISAKNPFWPTFSFQIVPWNPLVNEIPYRVICFSGLPLNFFFFIGLLFVLALESFHCYIVEVLNLLFCDHWLS